MAAPHSVDPAQLLQEHLASTSPDLVREMIATFANAMLSAQADQVCGADYGQRSPERTNQRNGYRAREWDTRAGTVELAVPKLRAGSFFPDWLLTHRRRAEQALVTVVATAYLLGVSTRRVERLAEQLGVKSLSRSQVSEMATHLDAQVAAFRQRPLDTGPYTFMWVDALTVKVREHGRVVNVHALIATGVNADGHREILGLDVASAEDGAGWLAFLRGLVARGLSGVQLVISRRPPRARCGDRVGAARRVLAALSHPLPAQPAHPGAQVCAGTGGHPGPHDLRPGRCRRRGRPVRPSRGHPRRHVSGRGRTPR
jgi:putative transposase